METLEAIYSRRSVRAFTPEPVPRALLRQVLEAGVASASGGNVQPWGFVLITRPERLAGLRSLAPGIIGEPTALIAVCLDGERAEGLGGPGGDQMARLDIGIATQNLLLAAHALGLGACPIGSFHEQAVATYLALPTGIKPVLLLAMGFPVVQPRTPGRRPLGEVCYDESWGKPYE